MVSSRNACNESVYIIIGKYSFWLGGRECVIFTAATWFIYRMCDGAYDHVFLSMIRSYVYVSLL